MTMLPVRRYARLATGPSDPRPRPRLQRMDSTPEAMTSLDRRSPNLKIRVVASVIERDGRLLVCQRPAHKRHGGLWEFPGGKVEPGESDFDAAYRELEEELGVRVLEVGPLLFSIADPGSHFVIEFLSVRIEGEPVCLEHEALAWLAEEEMLSMPLAPSDAQFVRHRIGVGTTLERIERRAGRAPTAELLAKAPDIEPAEEDR